MRLKGCCIKMCILTDELEIMKQQTFKQKKQDESITSIFNFIFIKLHSK